MRCFPDYRKNPIFIANHDPATPLGNFAPLIDGDALTGVVTFAPKGISAKADEWLGLFKAWGHIATFPTL